MQLLLLSLSCGEVCPIQDAEGQFEALLTRLRPTPLLLSDFDTILREEWQRSNGDTEGECVRSRMRLFSCGFAGLST